ncbi:MAG: flippase-like domain-containing protein [Frankiales bacterium]|nr:flippase-like domain-containing protein [Frankiales bacterium]
MSRFPRPRWLAYLDADHRRLSKRGMAAMLVTGIALATAALIGVAWAAGPRRVGHELVHADWRWLAIAVGGVVVSYLGYLVAYREIAQAEGGPKLDAAHAAALVAAGFGVFIPRGGFALDTNALAESSATKREAHRRVLSLSILEYAVLAPATLAAASFLAAQHLRAQPGLLPSWVIGVPVGTVITLGLLAFRRRLPENGKLWGPITHWLDAIRCTFSVLRSVRRGLLAFIGMAIYWAGDIAALGACFTAIDGNRPRLSILVVGYATGYALTRRSLPIAGAGAVEALLPFALSWVSLPLASAVLAVFAYRLFNLWLPVLPAAAGMRHLRRRPVTSGAT